MNYKLKLLCGALALTAGGGAMTVPSLAAAQNVSSIEEVVVTARKREESLQDVPIAVSAMTGDMVARKGIQTLMDLRGVPGLRASPHPSAGSIVQFVLRGQGAGDILTTVDQAVGVYLDGVYIARTRGLNAAFFDLDRVEVLKGPQGTLYGRNTTGGAITLMTKGADYDGVHGFVGGDLGDYSLRAIRAAVNIPIVDDKLSVRLAAQGTFRKGFVKSTVSGQDMGQDRNQQVYRATVRFDPAENFSAQLKAEHYRSRENGNAMVPYYQIPGGALVFEAAAELFGAPGCTPGFPPAGTCLNLANVPAAQAALDAITAASRADPFITNMDRPQADDNTITTVGLTLSWDIADNVQLKSITGARTFHTHEVFDLDGTKFSGLSVGVGVGGYSLCTGKPASLPCNTSYILPPEQKNSFFSQEFNLSGKALSDRLTWLGGVYYSNESGEDTQQNSALPLFSRISSSIRGAKVINKSWSLYSQDDFKLTDALSVTLGGRYTEERKGLVSEYADFNPATSLFTCNTGVLDPVTKAALQTANQKACSFRSEATFSGYSYLASLNWKITPDALAYIKTAKGFRGGAFQLRSPTLAPAGPESAKDIEIGLKSDWFERRLRANLAAYRTKYTNKQESIIVATASGNLNTVIQNAADATLHGFEGEFTAVPIQGLTLNATVGYIKGKYDKFPGALTVYSGGKPVDASGEKFALPPWTYTLSANYTFPVAGGDLSLQADYNWTDHSNPPPRLVNPNVPKAIIDKLVGVAPQYANSGASVSLMNARIEYEMKDRGITAALFVTNVFDKTYLYPGIDASFISILDVYPMAPRMWGVSLKKSFGGE